MKKEKGFTLIELMIVVAIIGILAAIAIPRFAALIDKAREAGARGNLGAMRSAIAIFYGDTKGYWPQVADNGIATSTQGWYVLAGAVTAGSSTAAGAENMPAFVPRYLARIPYATLKRNVANSRNNVVASQSTSAEAEIAIGSGSTLAASTDGGWIYSSNSGDCRINHNAIDTSVLTDTLSTMHYYNYGHEEP